MNNNEKEESLIKKQKKLNEVYENGQTNFNETLRRLEDAYSIIKNDKDVAKLDEIEDEIRQSMNKFENKFNEQNEEYSKEIKKLRNENESINKNKD